MTKGVRIEYGDYAVGAREDFAIDINDKESFVDTSQIVSDVLFPKYLDASENYSVALDGEALPFPSSADGKLLGWWSKQTSNAQGKFETPLVMTLQSSNKYNSSGFTFTFDSTANIYATHINITWFEGEEQLESIDFYPNSPIFFCEKRVEFFDKVIVTFYSINMAYARMKLYSLVYGRVTTFSGEQLKSAKVTQTLDPISSQLAINTIDFTLDDRSGFDHTFQSRQGIKTYFNDALIGLSFVKSAKRKTRTVWDVQTEDFIGIMDGVHFVGGIYDKKNAVQLMNEIFSVAKVPCKIVGFEDATVTGYIPYTTCREALMQVAFAIGAVVDTSYSEFVKVYTLTSDKDNVSQNIPLERVWQGQSISEGTRVTEVSLTSHAYLPTEEIQTAYEAGKSGAGEDIMVIFSEPLRDVEMFNEIGTKVTIFTNKDGEEKPAVVESGSNYAIINAKNGWILQGKKYQHLQTTKSIKNEKIYITDTENIKSITNATLISADNIDTILEICYNWLVRTDTMKAKVVERKRRDGTYDQAVLVGDYIGIEAEYIKDFGGRVVKSQFGLNGGILVKDVEVI